MRTRSANRLAILAVLALCLPSLMAEEGRARPLVDGQQVLASVNGEPITAEDLRWRIGAMHQVMGGSDDRVRKPDTSGLLQRMIDAKLIVQEARQIGLDELPETTSTLNMGRMELLKQFLIDERVKDIHQGDPAVVERLYRESVQEFKIRSVLFETREDAAAFATSLRQGTSFEQAYAPWAESGEAGAQEAQYLKVEELLPSVAEALRELEPGAVSAPLDVQDGVAVVQLLDVRVPEDAEARAIAETTALAYRKQTELETYTKELLERYVIVNEEIKDSIDLDSSQIELDAYRNDERIVARVKGAEPVTVGELTRRLEQLLYHGMDHASQRKRLNDKVPAVLERIVLERAMELEARRIDLELRPAYQEALRSQEESVLFGAFVRKVVNPEIKISDEEVESFYNKHLDEYMTSAMIRLQGLPFEKRADADAALSKLRQGSDVNWMRANADGLIRDADERDGLLRFDAGVLTVASLPEEVRDAVEGASAGDFALYVQPEAAYHVLAVQAVYPARPMAFADVRDQILQRIFLLKREQVIDRWTTDLRNASEIEIHANDEQIRQIVGLGPAELR